MLDRENKNFLNNETKLPEDPIKHFLETKEYALSTRKNYRAYIRNFLDFLKGEKRDKELKGSRFFREKQLEWERWDEKYPKLAREYFQELLAFRKNKEKEATESDYYIDPREELGDRIYSTIRSWLRDLKEEGMASSTINQNLSGVKQFFQFYRRTLKFTLLDSDF